MDGLNGGRNDEGGVKIGWFGLEECSNGEDELPDDAGVNSISGDVEKPTIVGILADGGETAVDLGRIASPDRLNAVGWFSAEEKDNLVMTGWRWFFSGGDSPPDDGAVSRNATIVKSSVASDVSSATTTSWRAHVTSIPLT